MSPDRSLSVLGDCCWKGKKNYEKSINDYAPNNTGNSNNNKTGYTEVATRGVL